MRQMNVDRRCRRATVSIGSRTRRSCVGVLAFVIAAGCNDPPGEPTILRFVDPALRVGATLEPATLLTGAQMASAAGSTAGMPVATILDDTRYVLAAHALANVSTVLSAETASNGHRTVAIDIGRALPDATQVLLGTNMLVGTRWSPMLPILVPVDAQDARRIIRPTAVAPLLLPFVSQRLRLVIHQACPKRTVYRTPPVDVPPDARLEFALGILESAARQGALRARVESCNGSTCQTLYEEIAQADMFARTGWQDRHVDLGPLAGKRRAFVFETAPEPPDDGGVSLPVWANPTIRSAGIPAPRGPNLILMSIDTLRRDHLSVYGYARDTSPALKALAQRGVVFDDVVSEAATTGPSHMTMMTGVPAQVHGVLRGLSMLAAPVTTLAEIVRAHGYEAAAFTEGGALAHEFGFNRGFAEYVENAPHNGTPAGDVAGTYAKARDWIAREGDHPFFLFVHTFQVHAPYQPPKAYERYFAEDDVPPSVVPAEGATAALAYDRDIRFVDDELDAFVSWLDREGHLAHTVVMVTADHGEEFYEHGQLGHGTLPYEQVLRVPLVVFGPGVSGGRRLAAPITHRDYLATIVELMGLAWPGVDGRSFADHLRGRPDVEADADRSMVSASWVLPTGFKEPAFAVRRGSRKLIRYQSSDGAQASMYFHLDDDPAERHDVYRPDDPGVADLEAILATHQRAVQDAVARFGGAAAGPKSIVDAPHVEDELRALGYVH
jgi:arylsulfatase A-like enzyme